MLIDDGYSDPIMSGHLYKEDWDTEYPVSLSYYAITTILRDSLEFDGVVISDELFMGALSNNYGLEETIITTINAGTDILLFNTNIWNDQSLVQFIIDLVLDRINDGTIPEASIHDSYTRIMQLKKERIATSTSGFAEKVDKPSAFRIQNYPNPFNPATTIRISLLEPAEVTLNVRDVIGREVQKLHTGRLNAGVHSFRFDGSRLSTGVYYVVVKSGRTTQTHPMMLVK